jgi:hypothetical protein
VAVGIALLEHEVASLDQPKRFHAFAESLELIGCVLLTLNLKPANLWNCMRRLRARHKGLRRRYAYKSDELASL